MAEYFTIGWVAEGVAAVPCHLTLRLTEVKSWPQEDKYEGTRTLQNCIYVTKRRKQTKNPEGKVKLANIGNLFGQIAHQ